MTEGTEGSYSPFTYQVGGELDTSKIEPGPIIDGPENVIGAQDVIRAGFEPLESHTGSTWIGQVWPEEHRGGLPETRPNRAPWGREPDGPVWFVRSPWPGITLDDALRLVWANLPRDDQDSWPDVARDVLAWPVEQARTAQATS